MNGYFQKCEFCDKTFVSRRIDARFCPKSDCRVKSHRATKRQLKIVETVNALLDELETLTSKERQLRSSTAVGLKMGRQKMRKLLEEREYQLPLELYARNGRGDLYTAPVKGTT